MRLDLGPKTRSLIAAGVFALLSMGFCGGVVVGKWVGQ